MIYRSANWTGSLIIKAPRLGRAINNYLDQTIAMFNGTVNGFYKFMFNANTECSYNYVKCHTLSGNVLTQIAGIARPDRYTEA